MVAPLVDPEEEEQQALCSSCYEGVPLDVVFILPCWNDYLDNFVTTYRCEKCAPPSFIGTRDRLLATTDPRVIHSCVEFFQRYKVFVTEYIRGARIDAVRAELLELVDQLRTGDLKLPIGQAIPIDLKNFIKPETN